MATEKLRAELEILTAKAEKDLKRFDRSLAGVERRITSMGGKGGKSLKPLGEGLSAATVNANEFEKSMAAANARVIAFGASAGLILQVQRALKETVRATIEVEKSLTDINVVLNANTKNLQKFGDGLFKIAGQTGQGFKTVAVAATELARQGLGMEQTLKRTSDALILTRLTGMQAEEAVSSLTAAVNSFSKAGITSSQVVNKMAKVDQAFAVSSDDLAKAISRVGSSAVDAGVSMDELLAITTAVQQRTARGGAVIGNAFKTIFTRIGRTDVQKKLAGIGVATRDMATGAMLPATKVLENLSVKFQELSKNQQNQIAESVAGVFQVNILRAALGDLSSKYGIYNRALKESATATNEAYLKNEQLNQTLDALVNKTLANLTKAGAAIGGATLKPAIENVLGLVNSAIGAFGEGGRFEEFGKGIGKDLMEGIGKFISGPGLVIATAGIIKLGASFVGFAKDALKGFADIGRQAATRRNVEAQITSELTRQPEILKRIQAGELSAAAAAKDMLAAMKATNLQADKLAMTSRAIAANMFGLAGGTRSLRGAGRAQGFIPNFANPNAERASAAMGGYKAGAIKTMNIPGQGSVMYNGAETVKRFPGMQQPAIMPPQGSLAGANYKKSFGAAHGFDPYAAGGFVPNFDLGSIESTKGQTKGYTLSGAIAARDRFGRPMFNQSALSSGFGAANVKKFQGGGQVAQVGKNYTYNASHLGLLGLEGSHSGTSSTGLGQLAQFKEAAELGRIDKRLLNRQVTFTNMQKQSISSIKRGMSKQKFSNEVSNLMLKPVADLSGMIFKKALGNDFNVRKEELAKEFGNNTQLLPPGAEGSIFEAAINLGILTTKRSKKARIDTFDQSRAAAQKPFDFEETGKAKPSFIEAFGFGPNLMFADAKRTIDNDSMRTLIKKAYNHGIPGLPGLELLSGGATVAKGAKKSKAFGHVPNFSPLGDAITRERAAGVPRSAIRVGASASLRSAGNPAGLGVYNTIDEPAGLHQGISRSRSMGINPKSHGVPNYALKLRTGTSMPAAGAMGPGPKPASPVERSKDRKSVEDFDRSTSELKEAAEELKESSGMMNVGFGKLAGITSLAYMATPMMSSMGLEEDTQSRMMRSLGLLSVASMFGGQKTGFRAGFGKKTEGMRRAAMAGGAAKPGFFSTLSKGIGAGARNMIGLEKGGKMGAMGVGKVGLKGLTRAIPIVGTGLAAMDMGFGIFDTFSETAEEQKRMQELQQKLANVKESPIKQAAATGMSQLSQFLGTFRTASGSQRASGFSDLRQTLLGDFRQGLSGEQFTEFSKAFKKFTDSFPKGAAAVESAGEDLAEVLSKLEKESQEAESQVTRQVQAELLRQRVAKGITKVIETSSLDKPRGFAPSMNDLYNPFAEGFDINRFKDVLPFGFLGEGGSELPRGEITQRTVLDEKIMRGLTDTLLKDAIPGGIAGINARIAESIRGGQLGPRVRPESLTQEMLSGLMGASMNKSGLGAIGLSKEMSEVIGSDELGDEGRAFILKELIGRGAGNLSDIQLLLSQRKIPKIQGDPGVGSEKDRAIAGQMTLQLRQDKLNYETALKQTELDNKTLSIKRAYNDALSASTRGLMGDSKIKLRESKISLQQAYDRNEQEINNEIEITTRQFEIDKRNIEGALKGATMSDKANQDRLLGELQATAGLSGVAARNELARVQAGLKDVEKDPQKMIILNAQQSMLQAIIKRDENLMENNALLDREKTALENGINNAELQFKIDKQILENKYKYNRVLDMETRQKEVQLQEDKNRYLRTDFMSGRITGEDFAAANARTRSMRRDAFGMAGEPMAGFGELMGDSYRYGTRNAAEDFERGMVDVAQNIRSGFKDSIKAVVTDSESFSDALVGVMDGLLDRTFETGLDVLTGKLFNAIGNIATRSKGGPIPRGYNQGGVVTGGSGVRDDVMTFMQGGEYVIKKSSAQRIGYSTLNAINSYASGGKARVSLAKDFLYTGDDPTRPTGGGYTVSRGLSTAALFRDDDPQTGRVFGRQSTLANYLEYRRAEEARRAAEVDRVKQMKRGRLMKAYVGAAMNIGAGYLIGRSQGLYGGSQASGTAAVEGGTGSGALTINPAKFGSNVPEHPMARGGSPALVQGGEYIMSPQTTAKYGTGFMAELNRGRMPGFNMGGAVGGGGLAAGGITTNNVNLAINIDKGGKSSVQSESSSGSGQDKEREDKSEVERQKKMGEAIRGVVLKEIERQQRPGGLLRDNASYAGGRKT